MVAATVLLDRRLALWTLFGVGGYPVGRLRVILALLQPLLDQCAWTRPVVVEGASEAEWMATGTGHRRHDPIEL